MFDWIAANWIWLLLGVGVMGFLFRRGGMGCGMGGHAHHSEDATERRLPPNAAGGGTDPDPDAGQGGAHTNVTRASARRHGCC